MAKLTGKEKEYAELLTELGVYSPAFDGTIHQMCILERELHRTRAAWKKTVPKKQTPSTTHELYDVILKQQKELLAYRDALGLTPKALRKLKGNLDLGGEAPAEDKTVLGFILSKHEDG